MPNMTRSGVQMRMSPPGPGSGVARVDEDVSTHMLGKSGSRRAASSHTLQPPKWAPMNLSFGNARSTLTTRRVGVIVAVVPGVHADRQARRLAQREDVHGPGIVGVEALDVRVELHAPKAQRPQLSKSRRRSSAVRVHGAHADERAVGAAALPRR